MGTNVLHMMPPNVFVEVLSFKEEMHHIAVLQKMCHVDTKTKLMVEMLSVQKERSFLGLASVMEFARQLHSIFWRLKQTVHL